MSAAHGTQTVKLSKRAVDQRERTTDRSGGIVLMRLALVFDGYREAKASA